MLGLVITTEDKMYKKDFSAPLFLSIMETIGGLVQTVPAHATVIMFGR